MAPKVIQLMHKQNSVCWVLLLRLLPLSLASAMNLRGATQEARAT